MLPTVTGEFRVVDDPELRFTPAGKAVASFRLAANSRKKNESTGEWEDDKSCFLNADCWERMAENVAESIEKGMLVVVKGRLETRTYENREGEKRTSLDLHLDEVGPSLRWDIAKVTKASRTEGSGPATATAAAPADDPWAAPPSSDEPPF